MHSNEQIIRGTQRAGFSLLEVLVVVSFIALIAGIVIGVSTSMADSGKKRATEGVLQVLDQSLTSFIDTTGSNPSPFVTVTLMDDTVNNSAGDIVLYPAIDGRYDLVIPGSDPDAHFQVNSIGLYLKSVGGSIDLNSFLSQIDATLVQNLDFQDDDMPGMLTILDGWGNPIRYVHPKFDGIIENGRRVAGDAGDFIDVMDPSNGFLIAEMLPSDLTLVPITDVRRNKIIAVDNVTSAFVETDSDGGLCPNQRPYFYSAGPDGDPSTVEDNVYTNKPRFLDPL